MYLSNVMLGLLYIYIIIFFLCEVVFKIFLFLICFFKNKIFQLILIIILAKDDCFQLILKAIDCKLNDLNTSVSNLFQKNETITIVGMDYFLTFSQFSRTYFHLFLISIYFHLFSIYLILFPAFRLLCCLNLKAMH